MKNETRLERLNHMVDVLKVVPRKKFRMKNWYLRDFFPKPVDVVVPSNFVKTNCKTAACAMGWAASDKTFRRAGLKFHPSKSSIIYTDEKGASWNNIAAASKFFGIGICEADEVFTSSYHLGGRDVPLADVTKTMVIKKIKALIKNYS